MSHRFLTLSALFLAFASFLPAAPLKDGDRIVLLGDAFFETERHSGDLECALQQHFRNIDLSLRNLSWSGDTPGGLSRASFDPAKAGLDRLRDHLTLAKPTVVVLGYGMAASLQELSDRANDWTLNPDHARYGAMTVERFQQELEDLLKLLGEVSGPDTRLIILSPIPHEDLRASRPETPDPAAHNELLRAYSKTLRDLATAHQADFIDSAALLTALRPALGAAPFTTNGIHLTRQAYQQFASQLCKSLAWTAPTTTPDPALRQAILAKSDAFFHRYRPANATYLFGFRKREQGKNAKEMAAWDEILLARDAHITAIKQGRPPADDPAPPASPPHPELAAPAFTVPEGYEITLWAEAPLVRKPVAMNWDRGGQLWVASTPIYPQIQPGKSPEDKIYVLADRDGDGRAESSTIFADRLLIPTGIAPVPADPGQPSTACYVGASTEVLLLTDTNQDGRADQRQVILSGFGTEDTHHNIHTLRWGPDRRLHFNQSVYTHSHLETPHGLIRLNSGGVLSYDPRSERVEVLSKGLWNSWGHVWNSEGQSILTDGAGSSGLAWAFPGAIFNPAEGSERQMPTISPGRYPKYAGLELIDSAIFPDDWQGTAVTCDFRAHRIVRFEIQDLEQQSPKRSGYITRELEPLVVTNDVAFRPIDVKTGPDGALYVADWTNPIINHGEIDFRDPRRDQSNGRIWRLTRKDTPAIKWTPTPVPVARSTDPARDAASDSPRRRIEAMRTLARTPDAKNISRILDLAAQGPADDPYYEFAVWRSIRDIGPAWVATVTSGHWTLADPASFTQTDLALRSLPAPLAAEALNSLLAANKPTLDGATLWPGWIGTFGDSSTVQLLLDSSLADINRTSVHRYLLAAANRGLRPAQLQAVTADYFAPATPDALSLLAAWKLDFTDLLEANLRGSDELRNAAFAALATLRTEKAILVLSKQLSAPEPHLRRHSLGTLAGIRPDLALQALPGIAAEMGADPAFWNPLLAHNGFLQQLAKNLPTDWTPAIYTAALQAARQRGKDGTPLVHKLEPLAGMKAEQEPQGPKHSIASLIDAANQGGDPAEGELIYRRPALACTLCHAIGGVGGKLGPDLTSLGASAPLDYIVESLLFPERKVKEGYHAITYTLTDGNSVVGIPSRTTATEQFVQTLTGEQPVAKSSIKSQQLLGAGGSLMPGGLLASLSQPETRSFLTFLQQLGRPGPYDASNGGIARLWTIHSTDQPPTTKAPLPDGTPLASLIDGRLTPALLTPLLADRPAVFAQTRFVTTVDGEVPLKFEGIREAWIDGTPLPVASEPGRTLHLPAGTHLLTIKLHSTELPPHLRASSPQARFLTE